VLVFLIFDRITLTNSLFGLNHVCSWVIALTIKAINVFIPKLVEFLFLEMSFSMRKCFLSLMPKPIQNPSQQKLLPQIQSLFLFQSLVPESWFLIPPAPFLPLLQSPCLPPLLPLFLLLLLLVPLLQNQLFNQH
jgi:hypothetical protein